jgi:hypothetical protein
LLLIFARTPVRSGASRLAGVSTANTGDGGTSKARPAMMGSKSKARAKRTPRSMANLLSDQPA